MISKIFCLLLIKLNYQYLSADQINFCDISYRDSLLTLGGIFTFGDYIFATRSNPNIRDTVVWRFKLRLIGTETNLRDKRIERIEMTSYQIQTLFPDLGFEYFVSGFGITDTNSCSDETQECVNTSAMKNLAVILGPKRSESEQQYKVYRFNGSAFTPIDTNDGSIPLSLGSSGKTTHWFSPSTLMSTTYREKEKVIIGFNYNDKCIYKLNLKEFVSHRIGNRYWDLLIASVSTQSIFYNLIEVKVSANERKTLLITEQMVYEIESDNSLKKLMHPWYLFGCKANETLVRSETKSRNANKKDVNRTEVVLDQYDDLGGKLSKQMLALNVFYILVNITVIFIALKFV